MKKILVFITLLSLSVSAQNEFGNLNKASFGYLVDWEYLENRHADIRYDLLTHLVCFPFTFDNLGNITQPDPIGAAGQYPLLWPWNDVIDSVRANNIKLIMSVAEFDSSKIRIVIHDEGVKQQLITDIKRIMAEYDFDGVNIDFEPLNKEDEGQPVIDFMKELSDSVHNAFPGSETSFDTPIKNWDLDWDYNGLAEACDYLFVMGYNYFGAWSETPGPTAPLTAESWSTLNLTWALNNDYAEAISNHPDKLILGLPYFGEHWTTTTESASDGGFEATYVSYVPFRDLNNYSDSMEELWSNLYNTSWYRWQDDTWHQMWIDNKESLAKKYDLMLQHDLMGVGFWSLGFDYGKTEYWELIDEKIGTGYVGTEDGVEVPTDFVLMQNYPNPFNPSTTIRFRLPESGSVSLVIYDILGRKVKTLVDEIKSMGTHSVQWGAVNEDGQTASNGMYIYQLSFGGRTINKKMILLK